MRNPAKPSGAEHVANKTTGCDVLPFGTKSTITGGDLGQRSANWYGKKSEAGDALTPDINIILTRINPFRPKRIK